MDDDGLDNSLAGFSNESGSGQASLLEECRCDVALHDLVLPPYYLICVSILCLSGLSILLSKLELRLRHGLSKEKVRLFTGTASLAALASPPWWFLAPQALYHIGHLVYIIVTTVKEYEGKATGWDIYTLSYAKWVNGGSVVFVVFGLVGGEYTMRMIRGQRLAAEHLADPTAACEDGVDLEVFRKNYLQAESAQDVLELQANYESKVEFLGTDEDWEHGRRMKRFACALILTCLLPALLTHIGPGALLYVWITGTLSLVLHQIVLRWIIPRQRRVGLVGRIVLLDFTLSLVAILVQDSFNFAMLLYSGNHYLRLVPKTLALHQSYCFFCSVFKDFGSVLHIISLA